MIRSVQTWSDKIVHAGICYHKRPNEIGLGIKNLTNKTTGICDDRSTGLNGKFYIQILELFRKNSKILFERWDLFFAIVSIIHKCRALNYAMIAYTYATTEIY